MRYLIEPCERTAGGVKQQVYLLTSPDAAVQAEVWPCLGCNCLRWRVRGPNGPLDLLYVAPDWENNPVPTRSGIPVLFPFPNRIRDGHFTWDGRSYLHALNDPAKKNSIHGFACRKPWRVKHTNAAEDLATFTAEFQASVDAPDTLELWPGDYQITLRFLLGPDSLSLSATITNPGDKPVPLGLGYHPYFKLPFSNEISARDCKTTVAAASRWELKDNLPTGRKVPVDPSRDLRSQRRFEGLMLDDVYTDLDTAGDSLPLYKRASVSQRGIGAVEVWTSRAFGDLVAFTPPHRNAICLEPYTCVTDAINLQQQGVDTGLIVLNPGESRTEFVVLRFAAQ
jgi:aldose 1-epimerase